MASNRNHSSTASASVHAAHWQLIEQIYRDHVIGVWQFINGRLRGDRDGADDVTATVFMTVTENIDQFDPTRSTAGAWVFSIARHKLADHLRKQYRERRRNLAVAEMTRGRDLVFPDLTLAEDLVMVHHVLGRLPQSEREALIWKYCDKLSTREIAERLGRTEKACENLLARARERFKNAISFVEKSGERPAVSAEVRHA